MKPRSKLYGVVAEFADADALLAATHNAYATGYRRMDAYTPFPVEGLPAALGRGQTRMAMLTLLGGIIGGVGAYLMMYYASVIDYPMNVGGRPRHSWPAFLPITFELTVLGAAFFSVFGMLALNGLPMPYHPLFNVPEFKLASRDRFFLCIESRDPLFEIEKVKQLLSEQHAQKVIEVEP